LAFLSRRLRARYVWNGPITLSMGGSDDDELPEEHAVRNKIYVRALVAGTALAVAGSLGGWAYAVTSNPAVIVTGPDHQRLTFTLAPGASKTFKLPAPNRPVRIDLDKVSTNGGVQTPSEVFTALVNVDRNGAGMSWIGTNSDGSQKAASTITSHNITNLVCGANCIIASLNVKSIAQHSVVLRANAATSSIRETYVINIWY
jgi:hypothetical protein